MDVAPRCLAENADHIRALTAGPDADILVEYGAAKVDLADLKLERAKLGKRLGDNEELQERARILDHQIALVQADHSVLWAMVMMRARTLRAIAADVIEPDDLINQTT